MVVGVHSLVVNAVVIRLAALYMVRVTHVAPLLELEIHG